MSSLISPLSLLFSHLRSPETGAGGKNLSSAQASKHWWVTLESQQAIGSVEQQFTDLSCLDSSRTEDSEIGVDLSVALTLVFCWTSFIMVWSPTNHSSACVKICICGLWDPKQNCFVFFVQQTSETSAQNHVHKRFSYNYEKVEASSWYNNAKLKRARETLRHHKNASDG